MYVCIRVVTGWNRHCACVYKGCHRVGQICICMREIMGRTNNMPVDKGCHGVKQALYLCMRDITMGWGPPWDRIYACQHGLHSSTGSGDVNFFNQRRLDKYTHRYEPGWLTTKETQTLVNKQGREEDHLSNHLHGALVFICMAISWRT